MCTAGMPWPMQGTVEATMAAEATTSIQVCVPLCVCMRCTAHMHAMYCAGVCGVLRTCVRCTAHVHACIPCVHACIYTLCVCMHIVLSVRACMRV